MNRCLVMTLALFAGINMSSGARAVVIGQLDDFEDGTTKGWLVAVLGATHPAPPVNISTGGPAGANDNYLLLTAVGGNGPGNRLSVVNLSQWAGDYLAAGIDAIAMDLSNLGSSDLSLRLLFANPVAGPPTDLAFSTQPISLTAGSGWTSVLFPITPGDLTAGTGSVINALTTATELRLYHSPTVSFPGPAVVANLGVDNIEAEQANGVPEPATLALFAIGVAGLAASRRRRLD